MLKLILLTLTFLVWAVAVLTSVNAQPGGFPLTIPTKLDEHSGILQLKRETRHTEFPEHTCSGAAILEGWAIFSAHCVKQPPKYGHNLTALNRIGALPRSEGGTDNEAEDEVWHTSTESILLGSTLFDEWQLDIRPDELVYTPKVVGFRRELNELMAYDVALYKVVEPFRRKRFTMVARREDTCDKGGATLIIWKSNMNDTSKIYKTPVNFIEHRHCNVPEEDKLHYVCACLVDPSEQLSMRDGPLYWNFDNDTPMQSDALLGFIVRIMKPEDGVGHRFCSGKPAVLFARVDRAIRWIEQKTRQSIAATRWNQKGQPPYYGRSQKIQAWLRFGTAVLLLSIVVMAIFMGGSVV